MEAREDLNGAALKAIVERIRETREKSPPEAYRNLRECLRQRRDEVHELFEGANEGVAKARTPGFVPVSGQRYVGGRLRAEADGHS